MPPESLPSLAGARPADLSDAEFDELETLLAATPEPLEPLDVLMLEGFLCGVIVQPVLLEPEAWLPFVFDVDGNEMPADGFDPERHDRAVALVLRRHAALRRALAEDGAFDPLLPAGGDDDGDDDAGSEPAADAPEEAASMPLHPISRVLLPWCAGFATALDAFPALTEGADDDAAMFALARILRHLPSADDAQREVNETLDREDPLTTLDDAIEDLVAAVADLHDATEPERYRVETVRRETPKVGRNDPCPCGSGKKFKQCHGRG